MRFSDALGLLSQQWKVPLSELTSYHRALRAADAIPAYSAGRGKQDVSEDAIIRFVLAYCTSRSPSICAERLPLALGMRRSDQMERHFPEELKSHIPDFFFEDTLFGTLSKAVRFFASVDIKTRLPALTFEFDTDETFAHMSFGPFWFPQGYRSKEESRSYIDFLNFEADSSDEGTGLEFRQTKSFGGRTLFTLAKIVTD